MNPILIASILVGYFLILIVMAWWTSRNADTDTFFTGNRQSPWYLVAFGMIGASLSGVTFISVPGTVMKEGMAYFQIVLGYILGYLVIAKLLMPVYYKLNVVSIYEYLQQRLGQVSYKTGAGIFILSRTLGSALRLFIATEVLHGYLFEPMGLPYFATSLITILLIWVYTFKGGIRTIVFTDTFQTFFLVSAVILCTLILCGKLDLSFFNLYGEIAQTEMNGVNLGQIFHFDDPNSRLYFPKQFFGGMFIAIAMTGLDQDLMQKNLTCKNLKEAQTNMYSFTAVLVVVNFIFLLLGGAMYIYAQKEGIDLPLKADGSVNTDSVFPLLAFDHFGTIAGVFFLLGITASSYASSDSALAALTTGFCIDFLNFRKRTDEKQKMRLKLYTHIGFSALFLLIVMIMSELKTASLIGTILRVASYTYGPLLGLFAFGLFTKRQVNGWAVPIVCLLAPSICYLLDYNSLNWLHGYQFSHEILILNGTLTFIGLYLSSKKMHHENLPVG